MFDRIVRIDCTARKAVTWDVPPDLHSYVGGIGYGTKILADEVDPRIDPLSEKNKIVLTAGPLTGTMAPMHPQACIVTKSPLSGSILDCYAGGFLGAAIKFAGLDGIIFEGKASSWVVILIDNGAVSFHYASPVVGKGTEETEEWMKRKFGPDAVTASIGVAGENLVAMASIFSESSTFGRGGSGAVLGSKMIKGFAVRGTKGVDVADRAAFSALVSTNMKGIAEACAQPYNLVGMFSKFGTGSGMSLVQSRGALATRNHVYGSFSGSSSIDGQYYEKNFYTKWVACFGCPVHCGRVHTYRNHDGSQGWGRGPEYETMFSFGSDLENGDPDLLAEVNHLTESTASIPSPPESHRLGHRDGGKGDHQGIVPPDEIRGRADHPRSPAEDRREAGPRGHPREGAPESSGGDRAWVKGLCDDDQELRIRRMDAQAHEGRGPRLCHLHARRLS
jgi:aldehyde:ferredoxin oxidoreductase